eukprot:221509-Chlamydomonas_euryale.AAC.2
MRTPVSSRYGRHIAHGSSRGTRRGLSRRQRGGGGEHRVEASRQHRQRRLLRGSGRLAAQEEAVTAGLWRAGRASKHERQRRG